MSRGESIGGECVFKIFVISLKHQILSLVVYRFVQRILYRLCIQRREYDIFKIPGAFGKIAQIAADKLFYVLLFIHAAWN